MAISTRAVYKHVNDLLDNDATLQAMGNPDGMFTFSWKAPEDFRTPFLIMERQSGTHHYAFGHEAYQRQWIFIKAITEGGLAGDQGREIMDRVHQILTQSAGPTAFGEILRVEANTDLEYIEAETGNIQYFHIGTVFKFYLGES